MLPGAGGIIDRYRLHHLLGAGGLGEVWEVEHRVLGTRRALKVLRTGRGDLLEEGRVQARLDHPNVLPVLDAFRSEAGVALVLPLVRGPSLARLLRTHRPDVSEVRALALALCRGLRFAHDAGVAHRDLKPANVLLDVSAARVVPRIADFGLAVALGASHGHGAGTPGYAAPEQLVGGQVGTAADWWSFGVVLYELLMGHRPFDQVRPRAGQAWVQDPPEPWTPLLRQLLQVESTRRLVDGEQVERQLEQAPRGPVQDPLAADGVIAGLVHRHLSRPTADPGTRSTQARTEDAPGTAETFQTLAPPSTSDDAEGFATEPADAHNLPAERETLIGRGPVLRVLRERLLEGDGRVFTITGPGGVGKTRLAVAAGRGLIMDFAGGVWLVDLSTAATLADVQLRIGAALGLPLPDEASDRLARALRGRGATLLLIDNAEVALQPLRAALEPLLDAAQQLHVLITSREPVRLAGESLLPVDVLEVPPEDPHADPLELARASPAVALFVARARAVRDDFALGPDNAADVNTLVRMLDGLPLALELAAARVRILSPARLVQRMGRRFDLLVRRGADGGPERHRALRATLEASWEGLSAVQASTLAQLGVFVGRPTLDDAEAVVSLPPDAPFLEDVLAALVDKSLVRVEHVEPVRFELLASIRAFALERLSELPELDGEAVRVRHAERLGRWGQERLGDLLGGHGGTDRRHQLEQDRPDLLLAVEHALDSGRTGLSTPLAIATWALLEFTGPLDEAVQVLERAAAADPGHGELIRCLGEARLRVARHEGADSAFQQALAVFVEEGDDTGQAEVCNGLGLLRVQQSRIDEADTCFRRAREHAERAGNSRILGVVASNRVLVAWRRRDMEGAIALGRAALPLHERSGDSRALGRALGNLAVLEHERGALDDAEGLYSRALRVLREVGDERNEGLFLGQLGLLRTELGELDGAERALRRSLRLVRRVGARGFEAAALGNLGVALGLRGRHDDAVDHHLRARELHAELGDDRSVTIDTANLGLVALDRGDLDAAETHLNEALERAARTEDLRATGAFLAERARVCLARSDLAGARERLERSRRLLRDHGGTIEQAKALCVQVELSRAEGQPQAAAASLEQVRALVRQAGVQPGSSLGRALARVQADEAS